MTKYFDFESESEQVCELDPSDLHPNQSIVFVKEQEFYQKSIFAQTLLFSEIIKIDN